MILYHQGLSDRAGLGILSHPPTDSFATRFHDERSNDMVERKIELNRRQHRRRKMFKLKAKLAAAKSNHDKEQILKKIHILSPWWKEAVAAK